jgi:amino acid transporter
VPFALVATILGVTAVMALAQTVAQGSLPDITRSRTPLADSAFAFMGRRGALMIGVGSVLSMMGHNAGAVLSGSRMLFALAENRDLPSWFARIHPQFRTPANCVLATSAVALALALSGTFEKLATASAVARLVPYAAACGSTLMLRHPRFTGVVRPATFVIPFGPVVPFLGLLVSIAIMSGATWQQLLGGLSSLVVGAALFMASGVQRNRSTGTRAGVG